MKSFSRRLKNLEATLQAEGYDEPLPPKEDVLGRFLWAYPRVMARQARQHPADAPAGSNPRNPYLILLDALRRLSPEDLARLSPEDSE